MRKRGNRILRVRGTVAYIDVSTDKHPRAVAKINVADIPRMLDGRGTWCVQRSTHARCIYVVRRRRVRHGKYRMETLHRLITGKRGLDHRNGDTLDNRRCNLRAASAGQNNCNQRPQRRRMASRFKGVHRSKGRWAAQIKRPGGRRLWLGVFPTQRAAAQAYDRAARQLFGRFAWLNFRRTA